MSNDIWILCSKLCSIIWMLSVPPSSVAKTCKLDFSCRLFYQILSYQTCLKVTLTFAVLYHLQWPLP